MHQCLNLKYSTVCNLCAYMEIQIPHCDQLFKCDSAGVAGYHGYQWYLSAAAASSTLTVEHLYSTIRC